MKREPCPICAKMYAVPHGMKVHMASHRRHAPYADNLVAEAAADEPPPEIEEFEDVPIIDPLVLLKTEVEMEADRNGHDLGIWLDHPGWAEVRCQNCGAVGTAADAPMAGVPRANHREFVKPCR